MVNGERVYLMAYVAPEGNEAAVPWHSLGKRFLTPPTIAEMAEVCGFNRTITLNPVVDPTDNFELPDRRSVRDSEGRYLGTVGPEYTIHQDTDLVALAEAYAATGLVEVDTAGMICGGSRIFFSLKVKDSEVEIVPGDMVKTNLFLGQGHDMTLSVVQGYSDTRAVCNNTVSICIREQGMSRTKHRRSVVVTAEAAAKEIIKLMAARTKRIEAYQFLASKDVGVGGVDTFIKALLGKEDDDESRNGGPGDRIKIRFLEGLGNKGQTWWHLLNAVTEDVTHGLGNKRKDDVAGDREGRAVNKMFFGAGAKLSTDAFRVALNLAQEKPASAKMSLDLLAA
jgi:phage/plasmid-like protein (TIGR03299 family)